MKLISQRFGGRVMWIGLALMAATPQTASALPFSAPQAEKTVAADELTVTGVVTDTSGEPLIGATVMVKGTAKGTATDFDGNFTIVAPKNAELQINYIGYASATVKVDGRTKIDIELREDSELLDEVVVVGYGAQKKESLTGAVTVVDSKMLSDKGALANPAQALQGQVPGVFITRSSAAPGAEGWNMKLRGSFSKNNQAPLVIIDGIESDSFNDLNPNDIKSINFLKDASAAIYGSKAAGGVIIVQTKSAEAGKVKVEYGGSVTAKFVGRAPRPMGLMDWADMLIQGFANDGIGAENFKVQYAMLAKENHGFYIDNLTGANPISNFSSVKDYCFFDTNWQDIMWGTSASTSHELAVSGGSEKNTFRISGRYMYDGSNLRWGNNSNQKATVRFNDNLKFSSHLSLESNITYFLNNNVSPTQIEYALNPNSNANPQPGLPASTIDGRPYAWGNWDTPNWVCELGGDNKLKSWGINIGETLRYVFNDNWDIVATFGYNHASAVRDIKKYNITYYNYAGTAVEDQAGGKPDDTYYTKTTGITNLYNVNAYGNWHQDFGPHHAAVMLGVQYSYKDYDYYATTVKNILPSLNVPNGVGEVTLKTASGSGPEKWQESQMSYFSRLNYNFDSRYLVEANLRYDGSSKFQPKNRWAFFWGVSAGWRINQEAFLIDANWLSDLKLRASYGTVGNQGGIARYDGVMLYNFTQNAGALIGDSRLSIVDTNGQLISLDRKWEAVKNYNVALDFGFLDNRLKGTVEAFWKKCDNMLISITYPAVLGDGAPTANLGKFDAHGYEGQLTWSDKIGNVNYHIGGTITYATNALKDNGGDAAIRAGVVSNREGYPLNSVFGFRYCGKIQNQDQLDKYKAKYGDNNTINMPQNLRLGDNMYEDVNNDGRLDEADLVYLGTDDPKISYSFNAGLSWKGFDLSVVFQGAGDRTIWRGDSKAPTYLTDNWLVPFRSWYTSTSDASVGNVWSVETPDNHYPTYTNDQKINNYNYYCSSWSVESGAYLRLKNVTLGYTFPSEIIRQTKIFQGCRIYVTGTDLWESTDVKSGYDPEASRTVSSFQRYPFTRNLTFGLNLTF